MLKKIVLLGALAAVSALVMSVAPASAQGGDTLTLSATPNPVAANGYVSFGGTLSDSEGGAVSGAEIEIVEFFTSDCSDEGEGTFEPPTTDASGNYTTGPILADVPPGHYYFESFYDDEVASPCLDLLVGAQTSVAPQVDNVYLCYSTFQTIPGVWSADEAVALVKQGYWEPTAVDGNVDGGVNVGSYHLQCNVTPKGDGWVGDGGDWFGPVYASVAAQELGFYPH